jgi:putative membrane protein
MDAPGPGEPHVGVANDPSRLAKFQLQLALDQATLAWVRTALTMASFGFGMLAFFRTLQESAPSQETRRLHQGAIYFGAGLVVLGLIATVLASVSHWLTLRRLRLGQAPVLRQWPLSVIVGMLFGILCLGVLWALFVS